MEMKNFVRMIVAIALLVGASIVAHAEEPIKVAKKDVPEVVLSAFSKAYPKGIVKTYSREMRDGKICYEIESKDGNIKRDIIYAINGDVMEIEEALKPNELPQVVMATITKAHPKGKIIAAERLTRGDIVQYESTIKDGGKKIDLVFSDAGELVKPTAK
jgi:hypothetical protein